MESGMRIISAVTKVEFVNRKQTTHRLLMERFNLKKLNEVDRKEQYLIEISNRFASLEKLDTEVDVNKAWETIIQIITISA
jgi:hypothetical protein